MMWRLVWPLIGGVLSVLGVIFLVYGRTVCAAPVVVMVDLPNKGQDRLHRRVIRKDATPRTRRVEA